MSYIYQENLNTHSVQDTKYYTPTIEEFYAGFEFEHFNFEGKLVSHPSNKAEWHKETCDSDWFNIIFDDYEHSQEEVDKYRVKYLDSEDIESLGFIQESLYSFKKDDWYIEVSINDLSNKKDTLDIFLVADCRFKGYIKNKSELKKLLKQIGVNTNAT